MLQWQQLFFSPDLSIAKTGCNYLAIELGEHFVVFTRDKFRSYKNFHIIQGDFETYDFGEQTFDLVVSAATIQWIPEQIGFPKIYNLLKKRRNPRDV